MGILRGLLIFGAGVYAGMYVTQNYKVPQVDKPEELISRAKSWFEEVNKTYKKSGKEE